MLTALLLVAQAAVAPIAGGNALTLPAARHLVRLDPRGGRAPVWLLALQQDGDSGRGLGFWRSDDEARTWRYYRAIQNDWSERDTADLTVEGNDVLLTYSFEGPRLAGSARHDVYFQRWQYDGAGNWVPLLPVRVFDSTSVGSAYSRGELARDSLGRIWVQAFRLEADGTSTAVLALSTDGGAHFTAQAPLAHLPGRGGGRLLSLGARLVFVAGSHNCCDGAVLRLRDDSAPVGTWSPAVTALPEGIYHGAALSAAADGAGGMHLVYKDHGERTWYRHFDGEKFGARQLVEGAPDWALQPAITRVGSDVVLFTNHVVSDNTEYRFVARTLRNGVVGPATVLDGSTGFKGYPAAAESLPAGIARVPCFYGKTRDANAGGDAALVFAAP